MFSETKNLLSFFVLTVTLLQNAFGQFQIGLSYGYNFNIANTIPIHYLANKGLELSFSYKNKSPFSPLLSITKTKTPLNYATSLINQERNTILIINDEITTSMILGTFIKRSKKINCLVNLGIGISHFSEPRIFAITYNAFFFEQGVYTTKYFPERKYILNSFIDVSLNIEKNISKKWNIFFDFGTKYYPSNTSVSVSTTINQEDVVIETNFLKFRPIAKIGCFFYFVK
jgi:hypothetical protein